MALCEVCTGHAALFQSILPSISKTLWQNAIYKSKDVAASSQRELHRACHVFCVSELFSKLC